MNTRTTFLLPEHQALFERDGYVVVDAIDTAQIGHLKSGYHALPQANPTAFESTMNNPDAGHKERVHMLISPLAQEIGARYLNAYVPVIGNFVVKQPSPHSAVPAHQDWNMCDETLYPAVNIWIALDDVDADNGAIYILRQGHRLPFSIRGNFVPAAFDSALLGNHETLTPIFLKAGQALIYDLRCVHASPANRTDRVRFAAGCACIPAEAEPIHYFYDAETKCLNKYRADASFYFRYAYGVNRIPEGTPLLESTGFTPIVFPEKIQLDILKRQGGPMNTIFKDPQHQEQYERDGYVVVDFLDEDETRTLLAQYEKETAWFREGFMSSVYAPVDGYKEKVDALLQPVGNRFVDTYMDDYRVIIGSFMVKGEGENSAMYPHQDWTLVDETRYASFNIWMPLVDVDTQNGALSIMRGGHRMPFTYRGSCVPDALGDYSRFSPDRLTALPMKAGQALVYDHRCIHVSPPNVSGRIRPAVAIGIAPAYVDVFHYFFDKGKNKLYRFAADKSFYFNHVANQFQFPDFAVPVDGQDMDSFKVFTEDELAPFFGMQATAPKVVRRETPMGWTGRLLSFFRKKETV